ncbi:MAG: hypothetical protein PHT19_01000 [Methylococcus sp.]|nr:hypothetical protein [Methylococcus sp.]
MKRFSTLAGIALFAGLSAGSAFADITLKDASEIVGSWQLETVSSSIKGPRIEENRTWEFRADGVIVTSGYNRHLKMNDVHEWKYQIVNGKISADDPGRPGRTIDYSVYEKTGDSMILKGGIEGFYFFKKR